jgi:hypothetical protein
MDRARGWPRRDRYRRGAGLLLALPVKSDSSGVHETGLSDLSVVTE